LIVCCLDLGIESDIGRDYAKMTMAAAIRQQVHKGDMESDSVASKLSPAHVVHHTLNKSSESVGVHRRMEREAKIPLRKSDGENSVVAPLAVSMEKPASMSGKTFPAEKKAERKNSLDAPIAVDMERAASMSRKGSRSSHRRDSIVAPLAVNTSLAMLKLVSHFLSLSTHSFCVVSHTFSINTKCNIARVECKANEYENEHIYVQIIQHLLLTSVSAVRTL